MKLKPNQAHYVLNALIDGGKIRPAQVQAVLKERDREMASLRERLASLERLDGATERAVPRGKGRRGGRSGRRPPKMTPKVRALRRLQGKYMGYVRRLKPAEKARVRAVREKQGIQTAIRVASSLVARSS